MNKKQAIEKQLARSKTSEEARTEHWLFSRRGPAILEPLFRDRSIQRARPYIQEGHVVADIGCGWGYYSFSLVDLVGPEGKVISVDLASKCIRWIQTKAGKRGVHNLEAHSSTAANLNFIAGGTVDFVFANGLLCSMAIDRDLAIHEIKRILKPTGKAYLSLGSAPPFGYVDRAEWEAILSGFKVEQGGSFKERWAIVSLRRGLDHNAC